MAELADEESGALLRGDPRRLVGERSALAQLGHVRSLGKARSSTNDDQLRFVPENRVIGDFIL